MRPETEQKLLAIFEAHAEEIVLEGADWVYARAHDLQGKRPKSETIALCGVMLDAYREYFETKSLRALDRFIVHLIDFRGDLLFRLSTLERGMLSFKIALRPILEREGLTVEERLEILEAIDAIYEEKLFEFSDAYQEKVTRRLKELATRAEASSFAKSELLANMSHEIRAPINAILGFAQLLTGRDAALQGVEDVEEYLGNILTSARLLSSLIDNLLDLSKLEAGRMKVAEEGLDLPRLVRGVYEVNQAQAIAKRIVFTRSVDPALPRYIVSDGLKLNQILMNLTANAIKFTPEGKKVAMSAFRAADDKLGLEVTDEGIGIPSEMHAVIFDPFEQAAPRGHDHRGTGLGLAITRRLVELLGGQIDLESAPGRGSRFRVTLPLVAAPELDDVVGPR